MAIKPSDLSPTFLKKIEDKYGPTSPDDFFGDDLKIYYKADKPSERGEGGGIEHTIIRLPSFVTLFKNLENAKDDAMELTKDKDLKNDPSYRQQASDIRDTYNNFRTWFRNNYPDQYDLASGQISEMVKEISTSGAAGGYLTKYAFKKKGSKSPDQQYIKMGYQPVNRKALRKKSKAFDYIDLYKD
jgi:hypothetical protein